MCRIEDRVMCEEHGEQSEAFVCQHIVMGLEQGVPYCFWWSAESESTRPDAWCTSCNEMLFANGGEWCERTEDMASVRLICGACYDVAKEMNLSPLPWWKFWWQTLRQMKR